MIRPFFVDERNSPNIYYPQKLSFPQHHFTQLHNNWSTMEQHELIAGLTYPVQETIKSVIVEIESRHEEFLPIFRKTIDDLDCAVMGATDPDNDLPLFALLFTPLSTPLPTPLNSLSDEPVIPAPTPSTSSFTSGTQQPMSRSVVEFMQFEVEVRINEEKGRESEGTGVQNETV